MTDSTGSPLKVYVAADHAGLALKNSLVEHIRTLGHEVEDMGAFTQEPDDDYPDFVMPLSEIVAQENARGGGSNARGIVIGGSGQGEAMSANRTRGIRCAVYYGGSPDIVRLSREHNDANVLSLGARFVTEEESIAAVNIFLDTSFPGDTRHVRRLAKF